MSHPNPSNIALPKESELGICDAKRVASKEVEKEGIPKFGNGEESGMLLTNDDVDFPATGTGRTKEGYNGDEAGADLWNSLVVRRIELICISKFAAVGGLREYVCRNLS